MNVRKIKPIFYDSANGEIVSTNNRSIYKVVNTGGAKCKVYTALLTQSGTGAPVATVLENTIGDIVWSYDNVGVYLATLAAAFPYNNTVIFVNTQQNQRRIYVGDDVQPDSLSINNYSIIDGNPVNGLYFTSIEIRVYN